MGRYIIIFFITLIIDFLVLTLAIAPRYQAMAKENWTVKFDWIAAPLVYVLILLSYYNFVDRKDGGVCDAFILGITTYGIYELTNKATINGWTWEFAALDTMWGGILFAIIHLMNSLLRTFL